jgi:hypothetical protein
MLSIHVLSSACVHACNAYMQLRVPKHRKNQKKKQTAHTAMLTPDHTHLIFGHHKAIIATLALLPQWQPHTQSTDAPSDQSGVEEA